MSKYKILVIVGERDISKYATTLRGSKAILKKMKEAAETLGLLDIFRGEIHEVK